MEYKKSNKIREIVRLQQILKKWRKIATSKPPTTTTTTTTTKTIKYLKRTLSLSDNNSPPKGYLSVSVGEEEKRFIIPTSYLGHRGFQFLLREAEEEFGFEQVGVLRIPCDVSVFESVVKIVEQNKKLDDNMFFLLQQISSSNGSNNVVGSSGYSCLSESQRTTPSNHSCQSPLCR